MSAITSNRLSSKQNELFNEKIGYDYANKKMIARVFHSLNLVINTDIFIDKKKNWANVVFLMVGENRPGYYSTIRTILKDIKVIEYKIVNGVVTNVLQKGPNWDRFVDEDWSWFITDTASGGYGKIVK